MSTLNNVLCGQNPQMKNIDFNSNKKKKSKMNNKKGQKQVKSSAKIICFKCKIEGHHVRSCPLKKKAISDKQQGKRLKVHSHAQPQVEERPLPKKTQANASQVEKSSEKKVKSRRCYLCHEKGHLASSCTSGNPLSLYPSFCAAVPPKGAVVPLNPAVVPLSPAVLPPQGSCFVAPFPYFFCLRGSTSRVRAEHITVGFSPSYKRGSSSPMNLIL